ncbi:MAG: hypothetical protein AAF633_00450 [Chloroflexota bacterium]
MKHHRLLSSVYLLRCWAEPQAEPEWRFRLEDPRSGEVWHFLSLDDVTNFLNGSLADKLSLRFDENSEEK